MALHTSLIRKLFGFWNRFYGEVLVSRGDRRLPRANW